MDTIMCLGHRITIKQLYRWVSKQKHHFCKYEEDPKSRLSAERVSLLKEMGAIDSWFPYEEESEDYSEEESEDDSEYEFEDYSEEESEDDSEDESEEDSEDESEDYSERKNSDNDINWENKLKQLIEFHKIHGHYNVPARWEEDLNLNWVHNQKAQWRNYEVDPATSEMSAERVFTLQKMGVIDSWRKVRRRTWEESCALLEEYGAAHGGDFNVPQKWKNGSQLGWWVSKQKMQVRKYKVDPKDSLLSADRIYHLEKIGAIKSWFPSDKSDEEKICDKTEDESDEIFEIKTEEESDEEASLDEKIVFLKNDIEKILEETKSIPVVTSL